MIRTRVSIPCDLISCTHRRYLVVSGPDYARLISQEYHKKCAEPDAPEFFDKLRKWVEQMEQVDIDTSPRLQGICRKGELEFRRFVSLYKFVISSSYCSLGNT